MFELEPVSEGYMPVYVQVIEQFRRAIDKGDLEPGDAIDPQDELAAQAGVGRMTINQALKTLKDEGLIESGRGKPTRVSVPGARATSFERALRVGVFGPGGPTRMAGISAGQVLGALKEGPVEHALEGLAVPGVVIALSATREEAAALRSELAQVDVKCEVRFTDELSERGVTPFVHIERSAVFVPLRIGADLGDPIQRVVVKYDRGEGDPVPAWFDELWGKASAL